MTYGDAALLYDGVSISMETLDGVYRVEKEVALHTFLQYIDVQLYVSERDSSCYLFLC
jgi:hypothetical protein